MKKILLMTMFFLTMFQTFVFANSWNDLPNGICAKYAAQEFEKTAPSPGVNWLNYNYDWVIQAQKAGWVVTTTVRDTMVGAIVEWQDNNRYGGHVAIVRRVLSDKIIVEESNVGKKINDLKYTFNGHKYVTDVTDGWGKTTIRAIKYTDMLTMNNEKFIGYIWPIRQYDYDKSPSKYKISIVDQMNTKEPLYKGFHEYWQFTDLLKEFDKIAPAPGVNWHGNVNNWIKNAQKSGWITTDKTPHIGALLIRSNPINKYVKVGIVRNITNSAITVYSRRDNLYPFTEKIPINKLSEKDKDGYIVAGYIWPVKLSSKSM